ncbi:MAG: HEAT repeat domain-containing protein [Nitrospiraceae bacterium]|nr:HEAT repeat domain-containing protein [Nitrospiraceae bacterium]
MQDLTKLLESKDVEVRLDAVKSLRSNPSNEMLSLLLKAMDDTSWRVRKSASEALLEGYSLEEYIDGLISLLHVEDNAGARNTTIESLIKIGKKSIPYLIKAFDTTNHDARKFIIDVLGEFRDSECLPVMLKALKDEDENVRASAIEHLGRIGEPAVVDALIEILKSADLWTAYPAADALGRIGDKKAIPVLLHTLSIKTLREPVLKALGRFSEPETLKYIVPLLEDSSKTIQEEALKAIKNIYHNGVKEEIISSAIRECFGARGIDLLISYARNDKQEVRVPAIFLLGIMKDETALSPLLELSQNDELLDDVKRAFIFIGRVNPKAILGLFQKANPYQKRFICEVASEIASPIFYDLLEKLLSDEDGHVRAIAITGLSRIGDIKAVNSIKKLLSDSYDDVQEAAVNALAVLKKGFKTDEFINAISDRNPVIRKNAALVLGKIGATGAVQNLGFALKDDNVNVRKAVIKALSAIKTDESVKFLMLGLTDEIPDIRASAALSLGSVKSTNVSDALILLLADSDDIVRVAAIKALGELKERNAVKSLVKILSDKNGFIVTTAIESLSSIGDMDAREALLKMISSPDKEIRRTSIRALKVFESIEDILIPYIKDDDWATRAAVIDVLGRKMTKNIRKEFEKLLDNEEDTVVRRALEDKLNVR